MFDFERCVSKKCIHSCSRFRTFIGSPHRQFIHQTRKKYRAKKSCLSIRHLQSTRLTRFYSFFSWCVPGAAQFGSDAEHAACSKRAWLVNRRLAQRWHVGQHSLRRGVRFGFGLLGRRLLPRPGQQRVRPSPHRALERDSMVDRGLARQWNV